MRTTIVRTGPASFSSLYEGQLVAEIERPTAFYNNCLGYKPDMFRPPYGELLPAHVPRLAAQNFTIVQWNLESNDHLILTNPVRLFFFLWP